MSRPPFTIGIIEDHATQNVAENVTRTEGLIRDAAKRGAQIICLKELFNAPYFCKSQKGDRSISPSRFLVRRRSGCRRWRKSLRSCSSCRSSRGRRPALPQLGGGHRRGRQLLGTYRKMHIPDDPLYNEKFYFTPGDAPSPARRPGASGRFQVWKTRYATIGVLICWDQWYPEAARITRCSAPTSSSIRPRSAGTRSRKRSGARRRSRLADDAAVARDRERRVRRGPQSHRPRRRTGHDGLEFFGHSFVADPFGRLIAGGGAGSDSDRHVRPDVLENTRRNWPFLRDRRIDAYGPILRRYLGA